MSVALTQRFWASADVTGWDHGDLTHIIDALRQEVATRRTRSDEGGRELRRPRRGTKGEGSGWTTGYSGFGRPASYWHSQPDYQPHRSARSRSAAGSPPRLALA